MGTSRRREGSQRGNANRLIGQQRYDRVPAGDLRAHKFAHEPRCHLRFAAVSDADEQHGRRVRLVHSVMAFFVCGDSEVGEQAADTLFDFIADRPYRVDALAGRVG